METLIAILREVRDPRDFNARRECSAMLFISLVATLCGARSCVDIADFASVNEADLTETVDLRLGAPSHDSFSRLFRLLDPEEMARTFQTFADDQRLGRKDAGVDPSAREPRRQRASTSLKTHPDNRSVARKMKLAGWKKEFLFELFRSYAIALPARERGSRKNPGAFAPGLSASTDLKAIRSSG